MSGGLYLGSVTLDGQQAVTKNLAKNSGVIVNTFCSGPPLLEPNILTTFFNFNSGNTVNGIESPLGIPYIESIEIIDNSLAPINMSNYKCVCVYGSLTTVNVPITITLAYSIDGIVWYRSSLAGVIIPPTINIDGSRPSIPFSRDFETAAPYVSLSVNVPNTLNIAPVPTIVPPATTPDLKSWKSVSVSSLTGQYQTACAYPVTGGIYISSDYGASWTQSSAQSANWQAVSVSATGQFQTACVFGGGIYYSSTYGATWTQSNAPTANWKSVSTSGFQTQQVACTSNAGIYYSIDSGHTWTQSANTTAEEWVSVSKDQLGTNMSAVSKTGIFKSTNHGINWTQKLNISNNWSSISVSNNNQYQVATISKNNISFQNILYTSSDGGENWTGKNAGILNITGVSISGDGNYIAICTSPSGISTAKIFIFTFDCTKYLQLYSSQTLICLSPSLSTTGNYLIAVVGENVYTAVLASGNIQYALSE